MKINGVLGIIINQDKKILLVKRSDIPLWTIPGGNVEKSETSKQAIVREIKEEIGINIKIIKTVGYHERKDFEKRRDDNSPFTCQTYLCNSLDEDFHINNEISELRYWDIQKLPSDLIRWHKDIILNAFKMPQKEISINKKIKMSLLKETSWLLIHPQILLKIIQRLLLNKKK